MGQHRRDQCQALVDVRLGEAPALHRSRVVLPDFVHANIERRLIHIIQYDWDAGVGEHHGNATAHGAGADDSHTIHRQDRRFLGNVGNLRDLTLAEEYVNERFGLVGKKAFGEEPGLCLAAFLKWHSGRGFDGIDRG